MRFAVNSQHMFLSKLKWFKKISALSPSTDCKFKILRQMPLLISKYLGSTYLVHTFKSLIMNDDQIVNFFNCYCVCYVYININALYYCRSSPTAIENKIIFFWFSIINGNPVFKFSLKRLLHYFQPFIYLLYFIICTLITLNY